MSRCVLTIKRPLNCHSAILTNLKLAFLVAGSVNFKGNFALSSLIWIRRLKRLEALSHFCIFIDGHLDVWFFKYWSRIYDI